MKTTDFTIEKMRNVIMQTGMCRKDKHCAECRRVNFCAIWNNRWPDLMGQRLIGKDLESYADYRVKDLPVTVLGRIEMAVSKTFNALMVYMQSNDSFFDEGYTGIHTRKEDEKL
jgi:hypothetical protein